MGGGQDLFSSKSIWANYFFVDVKSLNIFCLCRSTLVIKRNLIQTNKSFFRPIDIYLSIKYSQLLEEIKYPMTYNIRNTAMYIYSFESCSIRYIMSYKLQNNSLHLKRC